MLLLQLLMLQLKLWVTKTLKQGKLFASVSENLRIRQWLRTMSNRCKNEFDIFFCHCFKNKAMAFFFIVGITFIKNLHDTLTAIAKLAITVWKCMSRLVLVGQIYFLTCQANINTVSPLCFYSANVKSIFHL